MRIKTDAAAQAKAQHRSLAEKLEQEGSGDGEAVQFPAALRAMLDRLEDELRRDAVSEESRQCFPGGDQMFVVEGTGGSVIITPIKKATVLTMAKSNIAK
ncbi:hypothetical protein AIT66_17500 [Salmonella enterica subsp. salamae]|uniref:Uncharacterized protein n=1 Tax=Salmonella enterica subsp. salamae TaxID=59202 RepID=A0A8E6IFP6_SALER|nr:hypothetical protein AIT66_17500 [Salmonella enterica subsp. salamae]